MTLLRSAHGIETARVVLGHSSQATSLLYAEADQDKARAVMKDMG